MKKKTSRSDTRPTGPVVKKSCWFCDNKKIPNYKEYADLERFVTTRGKIVGRKRSGLCARHQRSLAREVKRARHIGLIAFSQ
ncbi:30S ribosomal protein S18 [Candidatus Woesebacteria bacterium RIFCSPHIGHO2_01_FULL_44_10]|uniref:30S ribosomal protein S18 n=1 Tax=Candidatus Woesebacteria bacterium RIFCSPLOWO2_01_FULL_44_14 TaxID=1802525 RepID=A0A1F8C3Y8_9BACT|nr:MAG: 30S ribosomal protein S18 [Candidatus Woesebacteria bacterium RIFCSPHIGHO2_01_FULL_44_10]OGM55404.1 MAG: 30S ribosomal protein S18 [Candidatus Woesebacteria bacterium RIFCSPHIGHO2_12_FULL_44_11]OGM70860.1 MAG: 30S ribosomal protein S18 [Candidatus Woesebacteria bacterium RIFCSPLOWO2_01_FULL_44_14]